MFRRIAGVLGVLLLSLAACKPATPTPPPPPNWSAIDDFLYQLQWANPERIRETAYDMVVVPIGAAGQHREVIEGMKTGPGGDRLVLCYVSIGQAATFEYYWENEWYDNPPEWLGDHDPVWAGDRWVQYWSPEWQAIIFGAPESYVDRAIALGFDGIYMDRVDTYYYYEELGRETAAQEMVDFIADIAAYARERYPGFGIVAQNAEELGVRFPDYMETVTGVGVEELYYGYPRDHEPSPPEWTAEREAILDQWVAAGKLVLTIDYSGKPEQIDDAYARAQARGYVPFVTVRSLGLLIINEGHEPD
jgi:cysteinyl-tRNA synthetase